MMVRPLTPSAGLRRAVAEMMGDEIVNWQPVSGGFSSAGLWVVGTAGGVTRFVKAATSDDTARFLRDEAHVYEHLSASFMPEVEAWIDDGSRPFLVMEHLSQSHWPPPWSVDDVAAIGSLCDAIAATPPPDGLSTEALTALGVDFWANIASNRAPIHALQVASPSWFDRALPRLIEVEKRAVVSGDCLVHADIRSDNVCIGDQVKVIDWNWAYVGNPMLDWVAWLPSLYLEGGPAPWELLAGETPLVARLAGFFLQHVTRPRAPDVRSDIRQFQRSQGIVALQWASRELGLSEPDLVGSSRG